MKEPMKEYEAYITYTVVRELGVIKARNAEEALKKAKKKDCPLNLIGDDNTNVFETHEITVGAMI